MNIKLSKRERECIAYMMLGMSAKQIGKCLRLSPRTVEYYIYNIKVKYKCRTKTEVIVKTFNSQFC
ncbi:MAG: helix-turn-helix transcriptional regulator [Gammaproteobacteria bacterium]|nr:helix-turn-helix transcriptional regulator [Gammaproteobacteria bacterium]